MHNYSVNKINIDMPVCYKCQIYINRIYIVIFNQGRTENSSVVANTISLAYGFTMGQNVRNLMSKYNVAHRELFYMHMNAIEHKCKANL